MWKIRWEISLRYRRYKGACTRALVTRNKCARVRGVAEEREEVWCGRPEVSERESAEIAREGVIYAFN